MEIEKSRKIKPVEPKDEGIEEDEAIEDSSQNKKRCKTISNSFKIENLANKLRALVALGILIGVLYIIVYNMFVPHSEKKEIPQEVIQTLLKLAAGSGVQLAPIKDQINTTFENQWAHTMQP